MVLRCFASDQSHGLVPILAVMEIKRLDTVLDPVVSRVCFRPVGGLGWERKLKIASRIFLMSEPDVRSALEHVIHDFEGRHSNLNSFLERTGREIADEMDTDSPLSQERILLLGACITQEYALEAAALFNPSIVPHPDQSGVNRGDLRFAMSLRAVGEGHISSIVFRSGIFTADGQIHLDDASPYTVVPNPVPNRIFDKPQFEKKLGELGLYGSFAREILRELGEEFTIESLEIEINRHMRRDRTLMTQSDAVAEGMVALARSNYDVQFDKGVDLSARVLFPYSPAEQRGIEDARFVLFTDIDGSTRYIATYTAYDGQMIFPQMVETEDFTKFSFYTLNGPQVLNKGMALFPRRVNGLYTMLSRQDGENLFLMVSDDLHFWYERRRLLCPAHLWEAVQIGNCGSPIETSEGWLVLTHGVGPMRRYSIGAVLLDLVNPLKVIGRLKEPLISPLENEREGYVPNVVYTCGGLIHNGILLIPYGISDQKTGFVTVAVDDLLKKLKQDLQ